MKTKAKTYRQRLSLVFTRCFNCKFLYDTQVGDFNTEIEVATLAEALHKDNSKKCKKSKLLIEVGKYYVENTGERNDKNRTRIKSKN